MRFVISGLEVFKPKEQSLPKSKVETGSECSHFEKPRGSCQRKSQNSWLLHLFLGIEEQICDGSLLYKILDRYKEDRHASAVEEFFWFGWEELDR